MSRNPLQPGPLHQDPLQSVERLQEIVDLNLVTPETDDKIQNALADVAREMNLPIALVSIVLGEAQYFFGMHGVEGWLAEARGTPMEWSFCKYVVRSDETFVVEDATAHPMVRDNPLVDLERIHCYAGVPLRSSKGEVLGSLCVIGDQRRTFEPGEIERLKQAAVGVVRRLESRRRKSDV